MAKLTLRQRLEAYVSGFDLLFEGLKKQIDNSDDVTFIKQKLREIEINTMIHKHLLEMLEKDKT